MGWGYRWGSEILAALLVAKYATTAEQRTMILQVNPVAREDFAVNSEQNDIYIMLVCFVAVSPLEERFFDCAVVFGGVFGERIHTFGGAALSRIKDRRSSKVILSILY